MKIACLVPAAGKGIRAGTDIPKQFVRLGNKTILQIMLENLYAAVHSANPLAYLHCSVATSAEWIDSVADIISETPFHHNCSIMLGGKERQDSVAQAFQPEEVQNSDIVLIHDAARPFIDTTAIKNLLEACMHTGAAVPVLPCKDTVKIVNTQNGLIQSTPDRSSLRSVQTPQAFSTSIYAKCLQILAQNAYNVTDDASIAEKAGVPIAFVPGHEIMFKITTPFDLHIAEMIVEGRFKGIL